MGRHAFIPTFNARHAILSDQTRSCSLNNIESRPKDRPTSSRHCFSAPHSSQSSSRDQGETDRRSSRTRSANRTSIAPAQYNGFKQPLARCPSQGSPFRSNASQGAAQSYYQSNPSQPQSESQYPSQPNQQRQQTAPSQGAQHSDVDQMLAGQGDRAEQVEHMQQYEANAPQSEADRIQAQLQKEFPNIDSSLIAALYSERPGSLGELREILQELGA